jgi:hypothetical protein
MPYHRLPLSRSICSQNKYKDMNDSMLYIYYMFCMIMGIYSVLLGRHRRTFTKRFTFAGYKLSISLRLPYTYDSNSSYIYKYISYHAN